MTPRAARGDPMGSVTRALLYANIAVYIVLAVLSRNPIAISDRWLMVFGQCNLLVLKYGWFWQLFTAMFVHVNLLHLLFNMIFLYYLGERFEALLGPRLLLATYIASGLAGNLLTLLLGPYTISAGASGALFGIIGALTISTHLQLRAPLREALYSLAIIFLINALLPEVNVLAHLGGLVAGIAIGYIHGRLALKKVRPVAYVYYVSY